MNPEEKKRIAEVEQLLKRVAVIGGGASGLIAACFASEKGNSVILYEKQGKLGRKILVTGNGRCNISNRSISVENYNGRNPEFVSNVFSRFGMEETIRFFETIGLPIVEGKNGKLFPASLQASSVVKKLSYQLKKKGVDVQLHHMVESISVRGDNFELKTAGREAHEFDSVILSAGSCAFPQGGGSMSGLEISGKLGHTVYEPFPAILPVNVPLKALHRLQGTKWDCGIRAECGGRVLASAGGEVLFTAYGLSGTAVLDVSRSINEMILNGKTPEIIIDFFPGMDEKDLSSRLESLWSDASKKLSFSLAGLINDKIPDVLFSIAGMNGEVKVSSLSTSDKENVVRAFKALKLSPGRPRPFSEAVVAAGGVDVNEIDPATMESRLVKNLYITGELLDIDGNSGGYNLQFAWSTGAIAGMAQ